MQTSLVTFVSIKCTQPIYLSIAILVNCDGIHAPQFNLIISQIKLDIIFNVSLAR
ncbi:hypothetical protein EDWATA_03255 [Edwardsiella tarda ATCC 23685]|uniref:Uncharacterized protein n=1 Tax=Edwardsiella tarda ATCC 23685 TaxID=500638 RepID=D4F900_EDWTA|nr:hypothetical protein EDWATA_03255 [Edwardsiella tarda ATCC 23685]